MNKVILNYLKMNLCVCIKKVGCPIKKKGGGGNVGQGVDALKRGGLEPP